MTIVLAKPTIITYVGATDRTIRVQATEEDGTNKDLSDFESATVSGYLGTSDTPTWKFSRATVTIEGGTDGWMNFTPTTAQIDTADLIQCQIRLVDSGSPDTYDFTEPFGLDVQAPIDNAP